MSIRCHAFIATSLDGFIARENGSLGWLPQAGDDGEDYGYAQFMARIDVLVMGRKTFETVLGFGAWPYPGKRVVVLSSTLTENDIPAALRDLVGIHAGPVPALVRELDAAGHGGIYVDGGRTIRSFLDAGFIDDITISRVPILIGSGIPLFGKLSGDIRLQHLCTKTFVSGLVQSSYRVLR